MEKAVLREADQERGDGGSMGESGRGKVRKLTAMKVSFQGLQLTARAWKLLGGDRDKNIGDHFVTVHMAWGGT